MVPPAERTFGVMIRDEMEVLKSWIPELPMGTKEEDRPEAMYGICSLWWQRNRTRVPILSWMYIRTMCARPSSAGVERLFSAAGLSWTKLRNRLSPKRLGMLLLVRAYMRLRRSRPDLTLPDLIAIYAKK